MCVGIAQWFCTGISERKIYQMGCLSNRNGRSSLSLQQTRFFNNNADVSLKKLSEFILKNTSIYNEDCLKSFAEYSIANI